MGERLYGGHQERGRKTFARFLNESGLLLPSTQIKTLIESNELKVDPPEDLKFTSNSMVLRLGSGLVTYPPQTIHLGMDTPRSDPIDITNSVYWLKPGEFILGTTLERVGIPNDHFGIVDTREEDLQVGITVHNNDGHIDPGFSGQITLEIKNHNKQADIMLAPGIPVVNFFITELSGSAKPYKGKYWGQTEPTTYRP